jgi:hypothetical protein
MKIGEREKTRDGTGVVIDIFGDNYGEILVARIDGGEEIAYDPEDVQAADLSDSALVA